MNRFIIFFFFLIVGCASSNTVYWCGDHQCINKKEQEAYFKKTMIVEIRDIKDSDSENKSISQSILKQAKIDEKERILNEKEIARTSKAEKKRKIKEEKEIAKQIVLEEKKRIKEEKEIARQIELEEKKRLKEIKKSKKLVKKNRKINEIPTAKAQRNNNIDSSEFSNLVKNIITRNNLRSYPDINDIPE